METHIFPDQRSSNIIHPHENTSLPPLYQESANALLLAETTTTQTKVITTTTTETTTQLFSLSNWKKPKTVRLNSPPTSDGNGVSSSSKSLPALFFDKALPPTPPDEIQNSSRAHEESPSPLFQKRSEMSATAANFSQIGIGHNEVSSSLASWNEKSTIVFTSPSSVSPLLRRAKSSQRLVMKPSEGKEQVDEMHLARRRRRGQSFNSASFFNISHIDFKGKGKGTDDEQVEPSPRPKVLSRKSSFWSKLKGSQSDNFTAVSQDEAILTLPALPPVLHLSPFDISDFPELSPLQSEDKGTRKFSANRSTPFHHSSLDKKVVQSNKDGPIVRPRTHSTPLFHRLSMAVFSSPESPQIPTIQSQPFKNPSRQHFLPKVANIVPRPLGESQESPEVYLARLKLAVSKSEVAGILASSADAFYARVLNAYISQFNFVDIPLDIALRKLLMEVGLPRETQQIDRVIQGFAHCYMECNIDIFSSEDHPYILAFSLIMLHTDVFNPSNKRKMTKGDYIKNTKLPGIPIEVLDCFFDNIVFAPFIFIEDPVDFNGQPDLTHDVSRAKSFNTPTSASSVSNGHTGFKIGTRIDPYYLIINDLLEPLRVDIASFIPSESPFSYEGTDGPWDEHSLHQAFINASLIEIEAPIANRTSPIFSFNAIAKSESSSAASSQLSVPPRPKNETWSLKITKVGLLNRKDDFIMGGKKASNRKWKTWSTVLTGSQLLFFRDLTWASTFSQFFNAQGGAPSRSDFKPDECFSVKDAIAIYDQSYQKYKHTLRFVLADGRQLLLQAANDNDLNEWISRINYASAFKSAGVRIRPPGLSGEETLLTGVAAATSLLRDLQKLPNGRHHHSAWDSSAPFILMDMLSGQPSKEPTLKQRVTVACENGDFDFDADVNPEVRGLDQFKATFDQVRAELKTADWMISDTDYPSPPTSPVSINSTSTNSRLPSRSQIIQPKIRDLETKISVIQSQLDSDLRHVRNIAILTPFRKSTRSRLQIAIHGAAQRIVQQRIEIEKLKCHRMVLLCDLSSEERSWDHSKNVALRVAEETLQSKSPTIAPETKFDYSLVLPSVSDDLSHLTVSSSRRPDSSPCGSFHSAAGFDIEFDSTEDISFLMTKSNAPKPHHSSIYPIVQGEFQHFRRRSLSISSCSNHIAQDIAYSDDDLAEQWNRTRCAKRVSLIRVPSLSSLRISTAK